MDGELVHAMASPKTSKTSKKAKKAKKAKQAKQAKKGKKAGTLMTQGEILLAKPNYVVARFDDDAGPRLGLVSTVCHNGVLCDRDSLRKGDMVDAIALANHLPSFHPARTALLLLLRSNTSSSSSSSSSSASRRPRSTSTSEGIRSAQRNDVVEAKIVDIDVIAGLTIALEPEFQPKGEIGVVGVVVGVVGSSEVIDSWPR